jgi:hypothetical protein
MKTSTTNGDNSTFLDILRLSRNLFIALFPPYLICRAHAWRDRQETD